MYRSERLILRVGVPVVRKSRVQSISYLIMFNFYYGEHYLFAKVWGCIVFVDVTMMKTMAFLTPVYLLFANWSDNKYTLNLIHRDILLFFLTNAIMLTVRMEVSWQLDQLMAPFTSGMCPLASWRGTCLENTCEILISERWASFYLKSVDFML